MVAFELRGDQSLLLTIMFKVAGVDAVHGARNLALKRQVHGVLTGIDHFAGVQANFVVTFVMINPGNLYFLVALFVMFGNRCRQNCKLMLVKGQPLAWSPDLLAGNGNLAC